MIRKASEARRKRWKKRGYKGKDEGKRYKAVKERQTLLRVK